ncbi:MAG: tetratricopeptide repeat protein [Nitrospirae bacterium]|nr:tetratricopeptide repeat protein [Nitrospirota bacterium]MBI5696751.1 tetratricopeptide repeat protein [Nitrospirota bacterium]
MRVLAIILAALAAVTMHSAPAACETQADTRDATTPAGGAVAGVQERAAREYLETGDRFFGKGEYETALASYDKAVALHPGFVIALNNKGVALYNLGRHEEAVAAFDRLLAVKPDDALAYINKGNACSQLGLFEEAAACFERAAGLDPKSAASAYNFLGLALDYQGRHDDAVEAYDKAVKLNARMPEPLNNKAYSLICMKKYDKALECLDASLALAPGYRYALINKAFTLQLRAKDGDRAGAEVILMDLLNKDRTDVIAARAYALLGMRDEMLTLLNSLLADNPGLARDFRGNAKFERYWDDPEFLALVGE